MSEYWDGVSRYDTGEPQYVYLKIWKHMPERCKHLALIRRKMWIAKSMSREAAFDKQYKKWEQQNLRNGLRRS